MSHTQVSYHPVLFKCRSGLESVHSRVTFSTAKLSIAEVNCFNMIAAHFVALLVLAVPWCNGCGMVPPEGFSWNYGDFDVWEDVEDSSCGEEKQQSPIDLYGDSCGKNSSQPFVRKNENQWGVHVANNGRTLKLQFDCDNQTARNGANGPLTLFLHRNFEVSSQSVDYDLAEIHFHWSESEHAIEGDKYPAEAHLKFKHSEHRDKVYHQAKLHEGALHAVGILLHPDNDSGGDMKFPTFKLEKEIEKARIFNTSFHMTIKIEPLKKLLNKAFEKVYRYIGSLTTPPCTLNLPWLVSAKPASVKSKLLDELNKVRDETGQRIHRNFRSLQEHTDELKLCLHDGTGSDI